MYQAEIKDKRIADGRIFVSVEYKDGAKVVYEEYNNASVNDDWLKKTINGRLDQLDKLDSKIDEISTGEFTPEVLPDSLRVEWLKLRKQYRQLKELVDEGIFTDKELDLDILKADLKTKYSPDFL